MLKRILFAAVLMAGLSTTAQAQQVKAYLGEVMITAGNFCPKGWTVMNGQILRITEWSALFSIIGPTYGGDGKITFALPTATPLTTNGGTQTLTQCIAIQGVFPTRD